MLRNSQLLKERMDLFFNRKEKEQKTKKIYWRLLQKTKGKEREMRRRETLAFFFGGRAPFAKNDEKSTSSGFEREQVLQFLPR